MSTPRSALLNANTKRINRILLDSDEDVVIEDAVILDINNPSIQDLRPAADEIVIDAEQADKNNDLFFDAPVSEAKDENTPLLPKPPAEAASASPNLGRRALNWLKEGVKNAYQHPIASTIGLLTSTQFAINALVAPSHKTPGDIGKTWWDTMSTGKQALSVTNASSSLWVNFPLNTGFIKDARAKLTASTRDIFKSPLSFAENLTAISLGVGGAVAAGTLAFNSVLFLVPMIGTIGGYTIAGSLGGLGFLVTSASRYVGVKRVFQLVKNMFSHSMKVQQNAVDALNHANMDDHVILDNIEKSVKEHLSDLLAAEVKAKQNQQPLSEADYEDLFTALVAKLEALNNAHPDNKTFFNEKTYGEYAKHYASILVNITFALGIGIPVGSVFMQKGYDGISMLAEKITHQTPSWDLWIKLLAAAPSGFSSGMMYAAAGADFAKLFFIDAPLYLYNNPASIPLGIVALTTNYFGSSSLENVAETVVNRSDGLLHFIYGSEHLSTSTQDILKSMVTYAAKAGGFIVNINPSLRSFKNNFKDASNPTVDELIQHFKEGTHVLSDERVLRCESSMLHLTFFKPSSTDTPDGIEQRHNSHTIFASI